MTRRALAGDCDLIAETIRAGREHGALYRGGDRFISDLGVPITLGRLLDGAAVGQPVTFTCAVPGAGRRLALDRDEDCALDGVERLFGGDAADPTRN